MTPLDRRIDNQDSAETFLCEAPKVFLDVPIQEDDFTLRRQQLERSRQAGDSAADDNDRRRAQAVTRRNSARPIKRALLPKLKRSRLVFTVPSVKRVRFE